MFARTISPAAWNEIERVDALVRQREDANAVPRAGAELLHLLVLCGDYRRGLEIGTSYGFSGLWVAAALQHNGGGLITIDMNAAKVEFARQAFARAGLAECIEVRHGYAADVLRELRGPFDFVFLDADKHYCRQYFELFWPALAPRATIVTDNADTHAEELRDFLQFLRGHAELCSTKFAIGNGMEVSVRGAPATRARGSVGPLGPT